MIFVNLEVFYKFINPNWQDLLYSSKCIFPTELLENLAATIKRNNIGNDQWYMYQLEVFIKFINPNLPNPWILFLLNADIHF